MGPTSVSVEATGEASGYHTMPQAAIARAAVLQAQVVQQEAVVSLTVVPVAVATKLRAASVAATVRLLTAWVSHGFYVFLVMLHCHGRSPPRKAAGWLPPSDLWRKRLLPLLLAHLAQATHDLQAPALQAVSQVD